MLGVRPRRSQVGKNDGREFFRTLPIAPPLTAFRFGSERGFCTPYKNNAAIASAPMRRPSAGPQGPPPICRQRGRGTGRLCRHPHLLQFATSPSSRLDAAPDRRAPARSRASPDILFVRPELLGEVGARFSEQDGIFLFCPAVFLHPSVGLGRCPRRAADIDIYTAASREARGWPRAATGAFRRLACPGGTGDRPAPRLDAVLRRYGKGPGGAFRKY
jgi:hypothetical protein